MTARPPLSLEQDPLERRIREQRALIAARRQRVVRAGLEDCAGCGGTPEATEDDTLRCVCAERAAALRARVTRKLHDHRTDRDDDRSERIAP